MTAGHSAAFVRRIGVLVVSLATVVLSACQAPSPRRTDLVSGDLVPVAGGAVAYLIGTIGVQTEGDEFCPDGTYGLLFRAAGGKESGRIIFTQLDFVHTAVAYRTRDTKGGVFAVELRPGNYEFHNITFSQRGGLANTTLKARRDFSLPFTLQPGRALYVGELTARTVWNKNVLQSGAAGAYFVRSDKMDRDRALIEAEHPRIKGLPVDRFPPEVEVRPFIVSPSSSKSGWENVGEPRRPADCPPTDC